MPRHLKSAKRSSAGFASLPEVVATVSGVIGDVRKNGDAAVRSYSEKFDSWTPESFRLSKEQIDAVIAAVPAQTIQDIKEVQANVRKFAEAQKASLKDFELEIQPGVFLGQRNNPINRVGW
jgi:histidinol dehydrogenase